MTKEDEETTMTMKNDSSSDEGLKWQQQLLQHESFPSSSTKASIQSVDNNPAGRRRLADWLPWKLFQEEMDPQRANHGWFIGKYARECLHILPKIPGKLEWPFRPVSVLEWHEVDESIREPGIYSGYRPEVSSWMECCQSLFTANNETLNFWTHFFPTVFFIWRAMQLSDKWGQDSYTQPFLVFMVTAILYPLMSALAHGFSALSHRARAIGFFMDYAAISFYAYGSALLYRAYVVTDRWMSPVYTDVYLGLCAFLSLSSTALTCVSRAFVRDVVTQRLMRLASFTLPYLWVSIPLFVRLFHCWFAFVSDESTCSTGETLRASKLHACQVIVALLASVCYASHLPERVLPGKFDYVGHSHNLLHICGVTATTLQIEGALLDLEIRRSHLLANNLAIVDSDWNTLVPSLVLVGHVLLVVGFGRHICRTEPIDKTKCH